MRRFSPYLVLPIFMVTKIWAGTNQIRMEQTRFLRSIDGEGYHLEAMFYFPLDGKDQHPLIIMTHGRNGPSPKINERQAFDYRPLCQALANRGYVVMMLVRRGYGNSKGPDSEYLETPEESGLSGAKDTKAAVDYMKTKPYALNGHIVIMGQSQRGWIALAASTLGTKGVLGAVNISGAINFRRASGNSIRSAAVEDQLNN